MPPNVIDSEKKIHWVFWGVVTRATIQCRGHEAGGNVTVSGGAFASVAFNSEDKDAFLDVM